MEAVLIQPSNAFELSLLKDFLEKTHIKSKFLSDEESEDIALTLLVEELHSDEEPDFAEWWKNTDFINEMDASYEAWQTGKEKGFTLAETDAAIDELRKKRRK